jgi:serine/threonine protein kinase
MYDPLMHPERVGRYELIRHLATGGMARVYLARATGLGGFARHVVIKAVAPEGEQYVEMFLDEARLAAMLHHQNIAQVFEVGCEGGTYFLVMEYVHGVNVRSLLEVARDRHVKLPLDVGVAVACAAAAGLHHAHECCALDGTPLGIVHRDVSPSNVILGYDGSIKLIDFGIAKADKRSSHTQTGFIKGKTGYMAPEQARGYQVDRRSDVFALGVLAYELTTQKRAFHGSSQFETMHKTIRGEVTPPSKVVVGYPPELEDVIMTALEVDPDDRFQDAEAMRQALEHVARELDLVASAAPVIRALDELFPVRREPWLPGSEIIVDEETPPSEPQIIISSGQQPRLARGTEPPVKGDALARGSGPLDDGIPVDLATGPVELANHAIEVTTGPAELVTSPFERELPPEASPAETLRMRPDRSGRERAPVETLRMRPERREVEPAETTRMRRTPAHELVAEAPPDLIDSEPPPSEHDLLAGEPPATVRELIASEPPASTRDLDLLASEPPASMRGHIGSERARDLDLLASEPPASTRGHIGSERARDLDLLATPPAASTRDLDLLATPPHASTRDLDLLASEPPASVRDLDLLASEPPAGQLPLPAPPPSETTPIPDDAPIPDDGLVIESGSVRFASIAERRPPRSMRAIAIGAAVLAGGFLLAMLVARQATSDAPEPPPPTPAPVVAPAPAPAPPPPAAPAPTSVQLHVTSHPTGATVVLDGVRLGTTPFTSQVPIKKDGWLKVRLQGHAAVKEKVSFEHDVEWDVALRPLSKI